LAQQAVATALVNVAFAFSKQQAGKGCPALRAFSPLSQYAVRVALALVTVAFSRQQAGKGWPTDMAFSPLSQYAVSVALALVIVAFSRQQAGKGWPASSAFSPLAQQADAVAPSVVASTFAVVCVVEALLPHGLIPQLAAGSCIIRTSNAAIRIPANIVEDHSRLANRSILTPLQIGLISSYLSHIVIRGKYIIVVKNLVF
jgi:hypothetical protein